MTIDEPWRAIPPRIGELIRPHVPALSDEVIEAIRERVPAYRRPLRGRFGAGIRGGVAEALAQFVDLVADPELDRTGGDAVYRALGRGEYRERRSLDALLAAYRLGARVAWRRVSAIAIEAGADRRTLALLAEAVFAYIDGLSALSADGYAEAQSAAAGESERMRRRVATLLLEPDPDEAAVRGAAAQAGWEPPGADRGPGLGRRRPPPAVAAAGGHAGGRAPATTEVPGSPCSPTPTPPASPPGSSAPAPARRWSSGRRRS